MAATLAEINLADLLVRVSSGRGGSIALAVAAANREGVRLALASAPFADGKARSELAILRGQSTRRLRWPSTGS